MTLKEYLLKPITNYEDYIFLNNFEDLFRKLSSTNDRFYYYVANHHKTQRDLYEIFEKLSKETEEKILLIINPDIDIPFLKPEIINSIENDTFTDEKQFFWDKQNINYFIDCELLNKIPKNLKIFCHSNIVKNEKITMIPLGRDFKSIEVLKSLRVNLTKKENLTYLNFSTPPKSLHWYGRIREYIYNDSLSKDYIKKENVCLNNFRKIDNQFHNYYNNIMQSKFMISPRGCGLDTYRLWDSLYLGCIPIVIDYENNSGYSNFKDLPILFLNSWDEYINLSEDFLNNKWLEMLEIDYNYDKLSFNYWKNLILNS